MRKCSRKVRIVSSASISTGTGAGLGATTVILDSRVTVAPNIPGYDVSAMHRSLTPGGDEVGYAHIDSELVQWNNESDYSSPIDNLSDSDGNVVRVFTNIDSI